MRSDRRFLIAATIGAGLGAAPARAQPSQSQQAPDRQQRLTSAESYLPLPTLTAGVINRTGTQGTLVVDMGVDVQDPALRARAQRSRPRLQDALRTALSSYANTYYRDNTAPDPVRITQVLQAAIDRTLGAPGARVLLANIIYQRRLR